MDMWTSSRTTVSNLSETMAWMLTEIDLKISGMHRLMIINRQNFIKIEDGYVNFTVFD